MRVLVAHPGLQHAHQLAWALEEAGLLAGFWSGVPLVDSRCSRKGWWGLFHQYLRAIPVDDGKRRHYVLFPLLRKLLGTHLFEPVRGPWSHRLDHAYDTWVARKVSKFRPDMVVCYENSALHTFEVAHKIGAVCVLDAASVHYRAGREWLLDTGQSNPAWVDTQKQREIDLADAILTCSEFAADTFYRAGVPSEKLFPVPLGTNLSDFPVGKKSINGTCRFVFVGSLSKTKSVDLLLDIFESFNNVNVPATLTLIGGSAQPHLSERARKIPNVVSRQFIPHPELFAEIARHDCLVLPSRFDSFGMVVPEALAVGVPVIVSDRVGAKCIIEQHPEAGWIVPCEKSAIEAQILRLVANREFLVSASHAAKLAARDYTWESYRRRVARAIQDIYSQYGKLPA